MRKLILAAVLVLMASGAQASSYLDIFGVVHDPIQNIPMHAGSPFGGNSGYSGPDLHPNAQLQLSSLGYAFLPSADLQEANLLGADLTSADLSGANLSGASLQYAYLPGANLAGASLVGANLTGSQLSSYPALSYLETNLTNSDLSGANLTSANLMYMDLSNAHLSGADLTGTNLLGADLSGSFVSGSPGTPILTGARYSLNIRTVPDTMFPTGFDPVAAGMVLVPEPSTALLLGIGLVGIAARRRV